MSKVMIIGAGGVGRVVAHKCAQRTDIFSSIILASRTRSRCDAIAAEITHTEIKTAQVDADLESAGLVGELSLNGQVRGVTGMLPMAVAAKERGLTMLYVPRANAAEAALVEGLEVIPVASLASLVGHMHGYAPIPPYEHPAMDDDPPVYGVVKPLNSYNPLTVAFHEAISLVRDCASDGMRPRRWFGRAVNPPGWSPDGQHSRTEDIKAAWRAENATSSR